MTRRWTVSLLLAMILPAQIAAADCNPDHVHLRWDGGQVQFRVEVADDPQERNRGLMFRESMGRFSGMLFAYPAPESVSFWMKNTLIPLDMLFFDRTGTVAKIHSGAIPHDLTPIHGGDAIQFVLEVNDGLAGDLGLREGAQLRHPLIDPSFAAWRCEDSG